MKTKRILAGLISATLIFGCLTGCGSKQDVNTEEVMENATQAEVKDADDEKVEDDSAEKHTEVDATAGNGDKSMKIVTTIFPEYDWVKTILGEKADNSDITLLLDNGVDLHSYTPSVEDIAKIKECDMFVYVGGESDEWVDDVIKTADNKDMVVINLLDVLGEAVKDEELVEGMEAEHEHEDGEEADHEEAEEAEHEDGEEADHEHEEGEEAEKDEHVWLSLRNAAILCDKIAEELGNIDEVNKDLYKSNVDAYKTELADLDAEYKSVVDAAQEKTLLFGDRFPFRYMVDDYGIKYFAAFVGCSAESEASFETVIFLAEKIDELGLPAIMTIEGNENKIAETVKENTKSKDQKILTLNSLQSTTTKDIENGTTYLSAMKSNLEVLKEAMK
ncbi:MAG: zinc ABC transporter substrate-binding protein [Eubacterium sp.]|nr:zinc ABC transporter substrate-binding protein [Eubacterium sp.]